MSTSANQILLDAADDMTDGRHPAGSGDYQYTSSAVEQLTVSMKQVSEQRRG